MNIHVVREFLDLDFLKFVEQYYILKIKTGKDLNYGDVQAPKAIRMWGDLVGETILKLSTNKISEIYGKELYPTYSFTRLYHQGDELIRHVDRSSCEYSATICLASPQGESLSSIYFETEDEIKELILKPGDLCTYKGCEIPHWREPLEQPWLLQLFLHYVDANGEYKDKKYDGRECLGQNSIWE